MYLETVMVCVNYADFLSLTLPFNKKHFNNIVVVTDKDDYNTQDICNTHNVNCIKTDRLYEEGAKFNKGKAINDGISVLTRKEWVLITDADMIMPKDLRVKLENKKLDQNHIYGTSRLICPNYNEWLSYLEDESICLNWKHQKRRINIGVGFFQLVNSNNEIIKGHTNWYSEKFAHCARSDRYFWRSFPESARKKLKDIIPIHLGDDNMGANWNGRTTPKWI